MRITIQATGEQLDRGNSKDDRNKAAALICRIVRPRFTPAARQRANAFRRGRATSQAATYASIYGEQRT